MHPSRFAKLLRVDPHNRVLRMRAFDDERLPRALESETPEHCGGEREEQVQDPTTP